MKITITDAQLAGIEGHARRAFPLEACGLITGMLEGEGDAIVVAIYPSENMAASATSFEIDPALHIRLQRDLRGSGEKIIGVYHSHPSGPPQPSDSDARAAAYEGWIWLVTALTVPKNRGGAPAMTRAFRHVSGASVFEDVGIRLGKAGPVPRGA